MFQEIVDDYINDSEHSQEAASSSRDIPSAIPAISQVSLDQPIGQTAEDNTDRDHMLASSATHGMRPHESEPVSAPLEHNRRGRRRVLAFQNNQEAAD